MFSQWHAFRPEGRSVPAMAFLFLLACAALSGCTEEPPPPPPPVVEPDVPPQPVFTQSQFDQLLYDMSSAQVRDLLGSEPTDQDSSYVKGESAYVQPSLTTWYIWENEDGSYIKLGFVKDKLTDMSSEDLPE